MADVTQAIDSVLRQEDANLSGVVTNNCNDRGGLTRFGLCAKYHQQLETAGFYDATRVPTAQALPMAEQAYQTEYAQPLLLAQINSQPVATALLSFAVNDGQGEAVLLIQRAVNACGGTLTVDGKMGPGTLAGINAVDGSRLVDQLCQTQTAYYRQIVASDPTQNENLNGWLNRVSAVQRLCTA